MWYCWRVLFDGKALYKLDFSKQDLEKLSDIELASDEDAPMGMTFHPEVLPGIKSINYFST